MQKADVTAMRRDTVLLVDDSPETLGLLTDTLDHAGYTVLIATDGTAALDLMELVTPDLVLMDAVMPGISGFETCKRLKCDKLLSYLPVIFMTGLAETEHVIEGLASGGVDYVTKPIVLETLLARIRVHLGNARLAHETHVALDASGRFLFATDRTGKVLWCTPKARKLLGGVGSCGGTDVRLPAALVDQLLRLRRRDEKAQVPFRNEVGKTVLECSFVSPIGSDELLFRLIETGDASAEVDRANLQTAFMLTAREAEVLMWVSCGKANRDIGEILNISPRTVNKHLEQVFVKLGVENRAAAAAVAIRALAR
ncbi:MAG TPA: DNA-binding response regulator [Steroidobacteraceae bacterium]|nr:DNA-binding response regulator [Steroidobacteraceae bacterium]